MCGPEKGLLFGLWDDDDDATSVQVVQARSPRILRANCISFGMMVTRFA